MSMIERKIINNCIKIIKPIIQKMIKIISIVKKEKKKQQKHYRPMLIMKHKNNNKIPIAMLTTKHTAIDNVSIKNLICKNQK